MNKNSPKKTNKYVLPHGTRLCLWPDTKKSSSTNSRKRSDVNDTHIYEGTLYLIEVNEQWDLISYINIKLPSLSAI